MTYLRAVALAHGHGPAVIDEMTLRDLEALAVYDSGRRALPDFEGAG